ncbi:CatB-related O-acetyltransferase [Pseudomonas sp. GD03862]|uniref:CatB-related O-acetyltransferase n=1 Tax=Pseudomonas sp. GD03862 TaxID=2975391 RepID=UPI002448741C|nr:CatB-related O-acetyltransferase [Pseudomonas sp. GD03862]MDH0707728.1 CatB-related O-acetyltransferase [Pseudomonas sp. GD03862]
MIDKNSIVHPAADIEMPIVASSFTEIHNNTKVGKYTAIGRNSIVYTNSKIGKFCSIGRFVEIGLARHPVDWLSTHVFQFNSSSFKGDPELDQITRQRRNEMMHPHTTVGNDVWIGTKASIASGVNVACGAIVFANAAVSKDVGPYEKYAGIPARKVGQRFSDEIIADLMDLQWWDLPAKHLKAIKFDLIEVAVEQLKDIRRIIKESEK